MIRRSKFMFLGTGAVAGMLAACSWLAGCQGSGTGTTSDASGSGGTGGSSTSATTATTTSTGTNPTTTGTGSDTTTSGAAGSTSTGTGGSTAVAAAIHDFTGDPTSTNKIGPGIEVKLTGVVAMSRKFLISKSAKGSCLWGVFISEDIPTAKPYTGVLVVDYGDSATASMPGGTTYCPVGTATSPAGGHIPDDVGPGDVLDLAGKVTSFAPAPKAPTASDPGNTCVAGMAKQLQLSTSDVGGFITRTKVAGPVPAPYDITADELAKILPQGTDQSFYNQMGGVKIRVKDVKAGALPPPIVATGAVGDHGEIYLADSGLRVSRKIYYQGLLASESDVCRANPVYADPATAFTSIEGLTMLDFCDWAIAPDNRCNDIAPPSSDCTGKVCAQ